MTVMTASENRSSLLLASWFPNEEPGPFEIRHPTQEPAVLTEKSSRRPSDRDDLFSTIRIVNREEKEEDNEPTTIESWLYRLGSILIETRNNLNVILSAGCNLRPTAGGTRAGCNDEVVDKTVIGIPTSTGTSFQHRNCSVSIQTDMQTFDHSQEHVKTQEPPVVHAGPSRLSQHVPVSRECRSCIIRRRRPNIYRNGAGSGSRSAVTIGRVTVVQQRTNESTADAIPRHCGYPAAAHSHEGSLVHLNDAWQFAGQLTRQRMALLRQHYNRLYYRNKRLGRRCRRLSRIVQRARSRFEYLQYHHQVLLKSIGHQVDTVTSNWADFLKRYLTAVDYKSKVDPVESQSGPNPLSRSHLVDTDSSSLPHTNSQAPSATTATPSSSSTTCHSAPLSSLYHWYSVLSLKLSWLQSSHATVFDSILYAL